MDELNLNLKVGDVLKIGKFLNRTAVIKEFKKDEHGQPIAVTDKGPVKVFKFRMEKLMNDVKAMKIGQTITV